MGRRHGVVTIEGVAHGRGKDFRSNRSDTTHGILVQEGIAPNGEFDFGTLDQVQRRIESLEFFESVFDGGK